MTTKASKDYSQGKIYKIEPTVEHDDGDIYIGSTTQRLLSQRMSKHRSGYKQWKMEKRDSVSSFKLFDKYSSENCQIVLLENVNASCYDELASREAYYIRALECINKRIPLRTVKQYYEENKDLLGEKQKEYHKINRDTILERQRQYYEKNKDLLGEKKKEYREINRDILLEKEKRYRKSDRCIEYQKEYREINKKKFKAQSAKYREENRDKINERQRLARQKKKQEKEKV